MYFHFIFIFTNIIQLLAAILAWRLVWIARLKPAWGLIAVALSLIVVRQSLFFYYRVTYGYAFDPTIELLTLTISVLILIGVARIGPFFITASHLEEAHRESEERFRTVAESVSDAIVVTDGSGTIISWNKSAQTIFGYKAQEVLGRPLTFLLPERFQVAHPTALTPRQTGGEPDRNDVAVELAGLKKDGGEFPLELSLSDWKTKEGTFYGALIRDITQRKWAEAILRMQLDFEQVLIDTIPFPIFYKDAQGLYIGCNRAFMEFFDLSKEDIIGKTVYDVVSMEMADIYFAKDRELFEHPGTQVYESVTQDKAGLVHDVIFHKATFTYDDHSVAGIIGAFLDISERKRAEDISKLNELRMEALLNLNQMAEAPVQEIAAFALEEATRLTGSTIGYLAFLSEDETVSAMHTWSKTAREECRLTDMSHFSSLETTGLCGEAIRQRRPVITNDYAAPNPWKKGYPEGHVLLTRHLNAPIFDGPKIVIVAGVGNKTSDYDDSDVRQLTLLMEGMYRIIQRKRAEEALRQSERQYRLLVNNIPAVVFKGYRDGSIEFFDNKIENLAGYSKEDFDSKKMSWLKLILPEDLPGYKEAMREALGTKTPYISEFRLKKKNGEILWVQARGQIINGQPGRSDSISGVFFDVSERKRFETERLMFSKIESLGLLAGGIAHDFNNILTAILGNISLAMMKLPQESQIRDRLQRSEKACIQAQALAQQLLTFAKGGAPVKTLIPLAELIHESAIFACRGSQARCEFTLDKDLWAIEADPGQVGQVFNNLLINAIQAMPTGGTINIVGQNLVLETVSPVPLSPGRYVTISIQDQGIGIPAEHLPNIFDPYYTTKHAGSGLGLATAYSIIQNHNGHISVVSKMGSGTTFHIYLPASNRLIIPQREISGEPVAGKGKILVMDDEQVVREVLGEMLKDLGYEGYFARDGAEAIKQFTEVRATGVNFSAVILDLTVPGGMGGNEALGHLHRIDPQLKAIVSSGYSDDPIMADYKKYGFSGVIAKPYRVSDLSRVLYEVIFQET